MRFTLLSVGKTTSKPCKALVRDYLGRLERSGRVEHRVVSDQQRGTDDEVRQEQSRLLLEAAPARAKLIVLDERGEDFTSRQLSRRIEHDMLHGDSHWAVIIGGANGHSDELRQRADLLWSLSKLTWPHELALVMVTEQLYRAMSIIRNEPYHRD